MDDDLDLPYHAAREWTVTLTPSPKCTSDHAHILFIFYPDAHHFTRTISTN